MSKPPLPTVTLDHAREMRGEPTDAERKLWQHLRAGRFDGLKFRRQYPIPPYIADFCCVDKKLVIELDGSQHSVELMRRGRPIWKRKDFVSFASGTTMYCSEPIRC